MLLAVDIGNSNIVFGLFDFETQIWTHQWRLETLKNKSSQGYAFDIRDFFLEENIKIAVVERMVLSSVVPVLTHILKTTLAELFEKDPLLLRPEVYAKLPLEIINPLEIGADLVANSIAAFEKYKKQCLIVDFGTALTFTSVTDKGRIDGVSIAPGLKTAMFSLFHNTAQLPEVSLELPDSFLGKNTMQALQAGVLWGYVGLVEFMIRKIKEEINQDCITIATGGLSSVLKPLEKQFDEINPLLTLEGLKVIDMYWHRNN